MPTLLDITCYEVCGAHVFSFFTTKTIRPLRTISHEFRQNVAGYLWKDGTHIKGSIQAWRTSFPFARQANLRRRTDLTLQDMKLLQYIQDVDLSHCVQMTDEHIKYIRGARVVIVDGCPLLTNKSLFYLRGVNYLNISHNKRITDKGLPYVKGVYLLVLNGCPQITDVGIRAVKGVQFLYLLDCHQITSNGLRALEPIAKAEVRCYSEAWKPYKVRA